MKKNHKALLAILIINSISFNAFAQQEFWSANDQSRSNIITAKAVARQSFPTAFKLFNVNIETLSRELLSVADNRYGHSTVISLPNADGNYEQFEVFEASNFEPDLQAQFPQIRAFSGKGITDKYATLKLSLSPQGIQTMVFRADKENEFIEPYSRDHTVYAVFRSQRKPGQLPWTCSTEDKNMIADINTGINKINSPLSSTGELKTMRLAQSCNGEYANYFGATSATDVALVLAAFNATLTRCNGVYEKDLGLHLNLIASTTSVIYYNPSTDPYTTLANWNQQLQTTLTSIITNANYDIGHMFGASGGGGNAGCIGCVCTNPTAGVPLGKGSGITSPADAIPEGDNFDIDYVVHEVGHQLGGNHTFSHQLEGSGVNKEVGSGITIMGYAGITNQDVAPHSIDIFHQASIAQIQANLAGKTCPITTNITANNATPVIAAVSNYTIPISTPFALTGSATDANAGDVLTYCWEQNNNSTTSGNSSVASPTKTTGPNWLSFSPAVSPTRLFPKLSTILAGLFVTPVIPGGDAIANIEALSSVTRTLNFRLTVRDNCPYSSTAPVKVGQTAFTDMIVTVTNTSGPFGVSSPNTAVSWAGLSNQTITWTVNNTTLAPVSCANVKISLSTDGGQTFPTVLIASTANDGSEALTIPNTPTTTARIKVEAIGNIFFDISNANFTITATCPPAPTVSSPVTYCQGATASALTATGASLLWYTGSSGGTGAATAPTPSTSGVGTTSYYVSQTVGGCEGPRAQINVVVNATPSAPTATSPVTYCQGVTASALTATGTNLLWYTVSSGGSGTSTAPTPSTTAVGTTSYYVSQATGSCEGPRAQIDVVVNATPGAPAVSSPVTYCQGASASALTATGTNLLWYTVSSGGSGTSTAPTPSTTNVGTTSYYVSQSTGSCEGPRAQIDVVINATPTFTVGIVNNTCHGGNSGSITVTGGTAAAPFTYSIISGPTINTTGQSSGIFTDLTAGNYIINVESVTGCNINSNSIPVTEPAGTLPDISLGSDYTGNFFFTTGAENTIVYNVTEIAGNPATGDTIRVINISGYNFIFDGTATGITIGSTNYTLDNSRWKLDSSNPAFTSLILDPNQNSTAGTLNCGGKVYVSLRILRTTLNISSFTLSSRLRKANSEASLSNNLNTIAFTAE